MGTKLGVEPNGRKVIHREFLQSNFGQNTNKYYRVEAWAHGGDLFFRATYGRVGDPNPGIDEKLTDQKWIDKKIAEKLRGKATKDGTDRLPYIETELHIADVVVTSSVSDVPSTIDAKVEALVSLVFQAAGESVSEFLAVPTSALSANHIQRARTQLQQVVGDHATWHASPSPATAEAVKRAVQTFYGTIPTKLPRRPDIDQVVLGFCAAFAEQEDRLNQLEAQIATMAVQQTAPRTSKYDLLGADLGLLSPNDPMHATIREYIDSTAMHSQKPRIRDIYSVCIPSERRAYDQETFGKNNVLFGFHGTRAEFVRHIVGLRGLIVPAVHSNGRMFGNGIYFADKSTKSTNYCKAGSGMPHFLFLADVAIGKPFMAKDAMNGLSNAPSGHHSVQGVAGTTGAWSGRLVYNEFIVYKPSQQTIRYIVTFDKC